MATVEASSVLGGREYAADSVMFRPRGNKAVGFVDRAFGIALAQGDWVETSHAPSSSGCIFEAVASGCVAPK